MRFGSLKIKVIFYLMPLVLLVTIAFLFFYFSSMGYLGKENSLEFSFRQPEVVQGLSIAGLIIILGLLVVWLLAEWIVRPIKAFIKGADEVTKGNLDYQFNIKGGDEIGELANTFNQMINSLRKSRKEIEEARDILDIRVRARTKELQEVANSLDEQVKQKTKELQERIDELEGFHKLTVGRELKMIQLKNDLQKAEKQLQSLQGGESAPKAKSPKKKRTKKG